MTIGTIRSHGGRAPSELQPSAVQKDKGQGVAAATALAAATAVAAAAVAVAIAAGRRRYQPDGKPPLAPADVAAERRLETGLEIGHGSC